MKGLNGVWVHVRCVSVNTTHEVCRKLCPQFLVFSAHCWLNWTQASQAHNWMCADTECVTLSMNVEKALQSTALVFGEINKRVNCHLVWLIYVEQWLWSQKRCETFGRATWCAVWSKLHRCRLIQLSLIKCEEEVQEHHKTSNQSENPERKNNALVTLVW